MVWRLLVFGVLGSPAILAAGILIWAGTALLISACRRPDPDLLDRLARFQPRSVGDEAEEWLRLR